MDAEVTSAMASRTKQKEEARVRRLAEEQALAAQTRRRHHLRTLAGLVVVVAAIIAVVVVISGSGGSKPPTKPNSPAARRVGANVDKLLAGIPQSGNTLGSPKAKVTVTEYGDLECSVCDEFALSPDQTTSAGIPGSGVEDKLIADARSGQIKLVYRSMDTASSTNPNPSAFLNQQTAAEAAGLQNREWNYVELFYDQQQAEGTAYVTPSFLDGLAREIPGLVFTSWQSHSHDPALQAQVRRDNQSANAYAPQVGGPQNLGTPMVIISGPKGQAKPLVGGPYTYGTYESAIKSVE